MSETTTQFMRKEKSIGKVISAWLGVLVLAGSLVMGFAKSFYTTPMKLEEHEKCISRLERRSEETTTELRQLRDIMLEVRGDIKVLNRQIRTAGRNAEQ